MIFKNAANIPNPLFSSIFHSVSAFCNAGFSLFSDSFVSFGQSPGINITITSLIIFGGLGFPVVFEIFTMAVNKIHGIRNNLSLQSKTVLAATIILIAGGALLFWIIESDNVLQDKPPIFKVFASLFQSVTCRTAGFNTVDIPKLNEAALFLLIMLMFIGASPGSCGGGVKTTTISVVVSYFSSKLRNRSQTALFKRGLTEDIVIKSFTLIVMYFFIISIFTFCISIIESGNMKIIGLRSSPLLSVLFEVVSAIGTVGLSTGITSFLSSISKYLIIILMLTGRVGLLSMAYVIIGIKTQIQKKYAEENIMIG
jgi:trk system potassium uptake protein TrkH